MGLVSLLDSLGPSDTDAYADYQHKLSVLISRKLEIILAFQATLHASME
jgi:hypothetical protein